MHKSSKWLIWEICIVILAVVLLGILGHPRILPYQRHKLLHILGAILLLGNIIVTAVRTFMAEPKLITNAAKKEDELHEWNKENVLIRNIRLIRAILVKVLIPACPG
jgi:hypothetical protein